MRQIIVNDDEGKRIGVIRFDGKKITSDNPYLQNLIDNDAILPKELPDRFEMIPIKFSTSSRMIFGNVEEV